MAHGCRRSIILLRSPVANGVFELPVSLGTVLQPLRQIISAFVLEVARQRGVEVLRLPGPRSTLIVKEPRHLLYQLLDRIEAAKDSEHAARLRLKVLDKHPGPQYILLLDSLASAILDAPTGGDDQGESGEVALQFRPRRAKVFREAGHSHLCAVGVVLIDE